MKFNFKEKMKENLPLWLLHTYPIIKRRSDISRFKDIHLGETCVVIGNGPSLNQVDFNQLRKFVTFGVNGIFYKTKELGFIPDYYVVEDSAVMKDNVEEIVKFRAKKASFFPVNYKGYFSDRQDQFFFRLDRRFYEKKSYSYEIPQFSKDCNNRIFCNQSVTFINIQLASYMGFKKILLVGMDHNYSIPDSHVISGNKILSTTDDPNHFHPSYFGPGKTWHDPKLHNVELSYKFFKICIESMGGAIINCTEGGKLEVFRREELNKFI